MNNQNQNSIFDYTSGEVRTATVRGHAISYIAPTGEATVAARLNTLSAEGDWQKILAIDMQFAVDHLVGWPWEEEISIKSLSAMLKRDRLLFFDLVKTIKEDV